MRRHLTRCLKYLLRVRYITSRVHRVRHIISRVKLYPVAASRLSRRQKIVWNRGLWLVGSPESRLLIGREPPPKIFKGGTLTVQNLCLKYLLRVRYITSRVHRVRHITSRVKRVGYITSGLKLYQEFPYLSPFVKCVGISRVVWNIIYAWDTSPHAFIAWDTSSHA